MFKIFNTINLFIFGIVAFISCNSNPSMTETSAFVEIPFDTSALPNIVTHDTLTQLINNLGVLMVNDKPYSGYVVDFHPNNPTQLKFKSAYINGKRYGSRTHWYEDGQLQSIGYYQNGKLYGSSQSWWQNGNKRAYNEYKNGKLHGIAQEWYREGMQFKSLHYVEGHEEGLQQAWRQNGTLYANYVAKNGRNYGMRKANLCNGVEKLNNETE